MDVIKTWFSLAATFLGASILPAVILLALGIVAIRLAMGITEKLLQKLNLEKAACGLIKTVLRVVLWGLLALMVADKLGIDVTGVVALASVLTLAISLSVQNALTNLISGFTLLYTKPFVSGDYVEIAGQSGTVQAIGLTYTKLSTPDNKMISIPNGSVTSAQIVNYTVTGTRRVDIAVSASYDAPVQLVLEALRQAAAVPTALEDPAPFVALDSYGESAMNYVVRVWSTSADYWDTYFVITENIKKCFDEKGIEMTYPHLNVHVSQ
ncbi:MAG: mechanosensitive ion channel family protein [Oscillospiraceae bacterium]|nr:mechanosensitive ion channel family protein [Oscillospiraceae bacterium]